MDPPRRGVVAAAAGGMGRVTVLGGVGPGGPLRRGRGGRGDTDTVPGTGGVAGTGGWPLAVYGVCGWSVRWLPSHSLVLFVHGGVGRPAVVVVGVVLVVVVVGPLVVVVWVVVGLVLRYGPWTSCGFSGPPCGGGGLGIVGRPWGCTMRWAGGADWGPGLTVTVVEGSHVPGLVCRRWWWFAGDG